ncbi:MAG: WbqC family protein [Bacteroidota bacterium]
MHSKTVILSTAYLPPVQYISALVNANRIYIEAHETYQKQTYRNRCVILSANGPLPLVIPVIKPGGNHTPITEVKIDYSTGWNRNHWRAIESAYRTSAYFDFIADILMPFYQNRFDTLWEFNNQLLKALLNFMELHVKIHFTSEFQKIAPEGAIDLRYTITPKVKTPVQEIQAITPYFQIFENRFGFTPDLSVIDLLFNEGLMAREILRIKGKG